MQKSYEHRREHYTIEKELAQRLKSASREDRRSLYTEVYDELFQRLPNHKQFQGGSSDLKSEQLKIGRLIRLLNGRKLLQKHYAYLEVGPGSCHLAYQVCNHVKKVFAVDVSAVLSKADERPENFELIISDGVSVPVPENSVDVVFSNQLMEHLHPEDAYDQLKEIYRVLKPGANYLCVTPNSINGPHDVSAYFDSVATCFHLKEYTMTELVGLFRSVGFKRFYCLLGANGYNIPMPVFFNICLERFFMCFPGSVRRKVTSFKPIRMLLAIKLVARK